MRKYAATVFSKFKCGQAGKGDARRTLWTDGRRIFSYEMPIAAKNYEGKIVVVDRGDAPSAVTASHIRQCQAAFPDAIKLPPALPKDWLIVKRVG